MTLIYLCTRCSTTAEEPGAFCHQCCRRQHDRRRLRLDRLPREHEDPIQALRSALLPEDLPVSGFHWLVLPDLAAANKGSALADQCLQPGDRIDLYELNQRLGAHGVTYRNIEPSSILADEAGQVRLLDFGVAKRLELYGLLTGRLPYRNAMAVGSDPIYSPVAGANR